MASMLRGGKTVNRTMKGLHNGGCSCCNSRADHRKAKKSAKQFEKQQWRKDFQLS